MSEYRRILIVKPSSLGDVVHALPTLSALRARFPNAHIAWLVKREWAELLQRAEGLDRVWPVERTIRGWLSQIPSLRAANFDLAVDLQGLLRSAAVPWLAGSGGLSPDYVAASLSEAVEWILQDAQVRVTRSATTER